MFEAAVHFAVVEMVVEVAIVATASRESSAHTLVLICGINSVELICTTLELTILLNHIPLLVGYVPDGLNLVVVFNVPAVNVLYGYGCETDISVFGEDVV